MEAIAITHPGLESVAEKEIKELLNPKSTSIEDSVVIFEPKELLDLCTLCYKAQSVIKILLLKEKLSFRKQEDIFKAAKKTDFSDFIKKKTFKVQCTRIGEHDFTSNEIEQGVGKNIEGEVDLEDPDTTIFTYIYKDRCYIGIDFSGFDLSKRQYRIFHYKDALKATVAYALLRTADYIPKDFLLDPFCSTGTIPIEAALYACDFPVNYFTKDNLSFRRFSCFKDTDFDRFFGKIDKNMNLEKKTSIYGYDALLGYVKAAQKNAKIAGINKKISVTRADIEWLDTKIGKAKVDKIVSYPPQATERNRKNIEKIYKELFHQADFVLKKKGIIVLVSESGLAKEIVQRYAKEYKFAIKKETSIMQGKKELIILLMSR